MIKFIKIDYILSGKSKKDGVKELKRCFLWVALC